MGLALFLPPPLLMARGGTRGLRTLPAPIRPARGVRPARRVTPSSRVFRRAMTGGMTGA